MTYIFVGLYKFKRGKDEEEAESNAEAFDSGHTRRYAPQHKDQGLKEEVDYSRVVIIGFYRANKKRDDRRDLKGAK